MDPSSPPSSRRPAGPAGCTKSVKLAPRPRCGSKSHEPRAAAPYNERRGALSQVRLRATAGRRVRPVRGGVRPHPVVAPAASIARPGGWCPARAYAAGARVGQAVGADRRRSGWRRCMARSAPGQHAVAAQAASRGSRRSYAGASASRGRTGIGTSTVLVGDGGEHSRGTSRSGGDASRERALPDCGRAGAGGLAPGPTELADRRLRLRRRRAPAPVDGRSDGRVFLHRLVPLLQAGRE